MNRVVITGAGTINPLGSNVADTLAAMREGRCGIGPLEIKDVDRLSIQIGGQVKAYDETAHFNRQQIALYDRFTQFTLLAAREAVGQSGLTFSGELADRSGVSLPTIRRLEKHVGVPPSHSQTLIELRKAFEATGVEFVGTAEEGPGVRIWKKGSQEPPTAKPS